MCPRIFYLAAGLAGISRDVEARSGQGVRDEGEDERRSRPERRRDTLGRAERSRETQTRQTRPLRCGIFHHEERHRAQTYIKNLMVSLGALKLPHK